MAGIAGSVGDTDGLAVGAVGEAVGARVGGCVTVRVGALLGDGMGLAVGTTGAVDGEAVGFPVLGGTHPFEPSHNASFASSQSSPPVASEPISSPSVSIQVGIATPLRSFPSTANMTGS